MESNDRALLTSEKRMLLLDQIASILDASFLANGVSLLNVAEGRSAFRSVLHATVEELGAHAASFVFLDPSSLMYESIVSVGYASGFNEDWPRHVRSHQGLVRQAVNKGDHLWHPNVEKEPAYVRLARERILSQLTLVLRERGATFAVLAIEWSRAVRVDRTSMLDSAGAFARLLQVQLSDFRSRVFIGRVQAAFLAVREIDELDTSEQRLDATVAALINLTGGGEVALLQRVGGTLRVVSGAGIASLPLPIAIQIVEANGYVAEVALSRRPFYCYNAMNSDSFPLYRNVVGETRSQFTVPLIFRNELVGILNVGMQEPFSFNFLIRSLLVQFAAHAAAALFHGEVMDSILSVYDNMRKDLGYLTLSSCSSNDKKFDDAVNSVRVGVDNAWLGLCALPGEWDSTRTLAEALYGSIEEWVDSDAPPEERRNTAFFSLEDRKSCCNTVNLCEASRVLAGAVRQLDDVAKVVNFLVTRLEYDRGEYHNWKAEDAFDLGGELARCSICRIDFQFAIDSGSVSLPAGNLVSPALWHHEDESGSVHQLGIALWVCDRILSVAGGFVAAALDASGNLAVSFNVSERLE